MRLLHSSKVIHAVRELKSLQVPLTVESDYMYLDVGTCQSIKALTSNLSLPQLTATCYGDSTTQLIIRGYQYVLISADKSIMKLPTLVTESTLLELKRNQLVTKGRKDTKSRYDRRKTIDSSEVKYNLFDVNKFMVTGVLQFDIQVRSYNVTIEVDGVLDYLRNSIGTRKISYEVIRKYLNRALDNPDLRIDCTCPDFKYRFAYVATSKSFKANSPEVRPASKTNPNNEGVACKHLLYLLSNKSWLRKYVSAINTLLKVNPSLLKGVSTDGTV